jgi:uncharacterized membrane protein YdbT with pleckstrin-like domain
MLVWLQTGGPLIFFLWRELWIGVVTMLPVTLFVGWVWFKTGYTVTDTELRVQTGPFFWTVSLDKVREVKKTRNLWSSAALSLDRVAVKHGRFNEVIYVSPADEQGFLNMMRERCPQADVSDGQQ